VRGRGLLLSSAVALLLTPGGRPALGRAEVLRYERGPVAAHVSPALVSHPTPQDPAAWVDVVALDGSGRQVRDLSQADLQVKIDGQPRTILSLRYVFRGPGAEVARAAAPAGASAAADPSRVILIAVDENSITRGGEKAAASAVWRVLDALAPADLVALVTLPVPRDRAVLSMDREPLRNAVARIIGRGVPSIPLARADEQRPDDPDLTDEQLREREQVGVERQQAANERQPGLAPDPGATDAPSDELRTSLQALARLLQDVRDIPGPKAILYFWAGAAAASPRDSNRLEDPRRDLPAVVEAAAAAHAVVHVVNTTRNAGSDAEQAARDTGGTITKSTGSGPDLARLGAVLSGTWLVEIESRPEDRGDRAHVLDVAATRKGVTVLAARRWMARDDPVPVAEAAAREAAPPVSKDERATAAAELELQMALARISDYLDSYMHAFSNVVVEEDYYQRIVTQGAPLPGRPNSRRLRSDLLLVRTDGPEGWTPFRDVFEVNGVRVRDREDRLRKLFLEKPETAMAEGLRITQEGARYNIGRIYRTINLPTLPLVFLMPANLASFRFEGRGEEVVEGIRAWRLDYEEIGRPTVVRQADTGRDLPSAGSLWLDPLTGRIVKTVVRNGDEAFRMEATVVYRPNDALGIWTPAEMRETYWMINGTERIMGTATYSHFRRFQVTTLEIIKAPQP
jgi:hypothetical protein